MATNVIGLLIGAGSYCALRVAGFTPGQSCVLGVVTAINGAWMGYVFTRFLKGGR